jgi:hypothetical protein
VSLTTVTAVGRCLDEQCDWAVQGVPNRVDRAAAKHSRETKHATTVWSSPVPEES